MLCCVVNNVIDWEKSSYYTTVISDFSGDQINKLLQKRKVQEWLRSHFEFTMVNGFFNVTGFSHLTMVDAILVCCVSNGGRMKAKFTIVKPSEKAWFKPTFI